jgi:hypothetical protein
MLKIITVATNSKYYFPYLKESVKRNGGELVVLGYNQEWTGFSLKYSLMINYLKTLDSNDIVCFVDGYDVICCRNLKDMINNFIKLKKQHNCKIVVGEDKMDMGFINNTISQYFIYLFYGGTCKYRYLNSGTYIGYSKDVLDVVTNVYKLTNSDTSDDQIEMKKYCRMHENDFYIDIKSELFLTMNKPYNNIDHKIKINNNKLYYGSSQPFFIHAPAGTYLDDILIKLGYNPDPAIQQQIKDDFYKKYSLYLSPTLYDDIKQNKHYIYILLIIIIFIIIVFIIYKNQKYYKKLLKLNKIKLN